MAAYAFKLYSTTDHRSDSIFYSTVQALDTWHIRRRRVNSGQTNIELTPSQTLPYWKKYLSRLWNESRLSSRWRNIFFRSAVMIIGSKLRWGFKRQEECDRIFLITAYFLFSFFGSPPKKSSRCSNKGNREVTKPRILERSLPCISWSVGHGRDRRCKGLGRTGITTADVPVCTVL